MARRPGAHGQPRGAARVSGGSRRDPAARRPGRARPAAPPARPGLMPSLTAPDGTQLVYDACEPLSPRAAVLFLHGWSDHAGRWSGVGERLRDAGFAVYLLDQRGHGRSGGRRGYLSRFSQLLGDLQAFRRAVRLRTDRPQLLLGISFGWLVAMRYLET